MKKSLVAVLIAAALLAFPTPAQAKTNHWGKDLVWDDWVALSLEEADGFCEDYERNPKYMVSYLYHEYKGARYQGHKAKVSKAYLKGMFIYLCDSYPRPYWPDDYRPW